MIDNSSKPLLQDALRKAEAIMLLGDLGVPKIDVVESVGTSDEALIWVHLGCAWLKLSIIADLAEFYCKELNKSLNWLGYGKVLKAIGAAAGARRTSFHCYQSAVDLSPEFAEAHFALGRIAQLSGATEAAYQNFEACLKYAPHPKAVGDEHLHANAHWEIAGIQEELGQLPQALSSYSDALAKLGNFGVHQVRYANLLRNMGYLEQAANQYLTCTSYTHRYFPEFFPPPITMSGAANERSHLDVILTRPDGANIYFYNGSYVLLPNGVAAKSVEELVKLMNPTSYETTGLGYRVLSLLRNVIQKHPHKVSVKMASSVVELVD